MKNQLLVTILSVALASTTRALDAQAPAQNVRFDASSIRANTDISTIINGTEFVIGGRYAIKNYPLRRLIADAFDLSWSQMNDQLVGGPDWLPLEKYDIAATTELLTPTRGQFRAMLGNLLKDRFALATHVEQRQVAVYELRLGRADGKLGAGLRRFTGDCKALSASGGTGCVSSHGGTRHTAVGMPLVTLYVGQLGRAVERTIIDRTNLTGLFDWELHTQRYASVSSISAARDESGE